MVTSNDFWSKIVEICNNNCPRYIVLTSYGLHHAFNNYRDKYGNVIPYSMNPLQKLLYIMNDTPLKSWLFVCPPCIHIPGNKKPIPNYKKIESEVKFLHDNFKNIDCRIHIHTHTKFLFLNYGDKCEIYNGGSNATSSKDDYFYNAMTKVWYDDKKIVSNILLKILHESKKSHEVFSELNNHDKINHG